MKISIRKLIPTAALLVLAMGTAQADPILVNPTASTSSVNVSINSSSCAWLIGCHVSTELSSGLNAASSWLNPGDSWTFNFFDIMVSGLGTVSDATVQATLGFLSPVSTAAASGQGSFSTFFGIISEGSLVWDQPAYINLGDGTGLMVAFEDLHEFGLGGRTTVSATVSRYGSAMAVPEPGTLALLGLGLLGIAVAKRKAAA